MNNELLMTVRKPRDYLTVLIEIILKLKSQTKELT